MTRCKPLCATGAFVRVRVSVSSAHAGVRWRCCTTGSNELTGGYNVLRTDEHDLYEGDDYQQRGGLGGKEHLYEL